MSFIAENVLSHSAVDEERESIKLTKMRKIGNLVDHIRFIFPQEISFKFSNPEFAS